MNKVFRILRDDRSTQDKINGVFDVAPYVETKFNRVKYRFCNGVWLITVPQSICGEYPMSDNEIQWMKNMINKKYKGI